MRYFTAYNVYKLSFVSQYSSVECVLIPYLICTLSLSQEVIEVEAVEVEEVGEKKKKKKKKEREEEEE